MDSTRQEKERQLTGAIVRVARIYRKEVNRALTGYGISDSLAVPVLHIARFGGGMRQSCLAEEIGLQGPSLVRLLDQLCAQNLVERREDGLDKRAKTLHLTPAGEELAERVETLLMQIRGQLLESLSDADVEAGLRVMAALHLELDAAGSRAGR